MTIQYTKYITKDSFYHLTYQKLILVPLIDLRSYNTCHQGYQYMETCSIVSKLFHERTKSKKLSQYKFYISRLF